MVIYVSQVIAYVLLTIEMAMKVGENSSWRNTSNGNPQLGELRICAHEGAREICTISFCEQNRLRVHWSGVVKKLAIWQIRSKVSSL